MRVVPVQPGRRLMPGKRISSFSDADDVLNWLKQFHVTLPTTRLAELFYQTRHGGPDWLLFVRSTKFGFVLRITEGRLEMPNRYASSFSGAEAIKAWLLRYGLFIDMGQIAGWWQDVQNKTCDWKIRVYRRNGGNWKLFTEKRHIAK